MFIYIENNKFKEFVNLFVEKKLFRLRWDSSPGLSIAGRLGNRKTWARIPAQSKAFFFRRNIFKFFKNICIQLHLFAI